MWTHDAKLHILHRSGLASGPVQSVDYRNQMHHSNRPQCSRLTQLMRLLAVD